MTKLKSNATSKEIHKVCEKHFFEIVGSMFLVFLVHSLYYALIYGGVMAVICEKILPMLGYALFAENFTYLWYILLGASLKYKTIAEQVGDVALSIVDRKVFELRG